MKSEQGDSGHAQAKMVADVYSHIIDEYRMEWTIIFVCKPFDALYCPLCVSSNVIRAVHRLRNRIEGTVAALRAAERDMDV